MANTVHLISKEYLNPNKLSSIIEKIAEKLNYNSWKTYSQEFDIMDINLSKEESSSGFLETSISCRSDFNNTFGNLYNIDGYGIMISINYGYEDILLLPFLKKILEEISELLIYNEETPKGIGSFIFNKNHLDNFSGTDSYTFLNNPPKDLNISI